MQVNIPCACQEQLFKNLGAFYGIELLTFVDKEACCTKLIDGEVEVRRLPAIIAYLERYSGKIVSADMDQML